MIDRKKFFLFGRFFKLEMERKIETKRMLIRPPVPADSQEIARGRNAAFVQRYNLYRTSTADEVEQELSQADGFVLEEKETGAFIGCIFVQEDYLRYHVPSVEIIGWLKEEYASKGYMTEGVCAALNLLFEENVCDRVTARIFSPNVGAKRVVEKLGFVHEGCLRGAVKNAAGEIFDVELYSITKQEHEKNKA